MKNIEQIIRNLKKTIAGKGNPETISALKRRLLLIEKKHKKDEQD